MATLVLFLHLVFVHSPGYAWSAAEITDAYRQTQVALNWWNGQDKRIEYRIADLSVVGAPQTATLDLSRQVSIIAPLYDGVGGMAVFIAKNHPPYWKGARYANAAWQLGNMIYVLYGDGYTQFYVAHEVGHWKGLADGCAPDRLDLMCGIPTLELSERTQRELSRR